MTLDRTRPGLAGSRCADRAPDRAGAAQRIARTERALHRRGPALHPTDVPENPRRGLSPTSSPRSGAHRPQPPRSRAGHGLSRLWGAHPVGHAPPRGLHRPAAAAHRPRARLRPLLRRQVLVVGGDAWVLRADGFDEADLFRIGGATSLRGYDEEQFRARTAARAVAEVRYQVDADLLRLPLRRRRLRRPARARRTRRGVAASAPATASACNSTRPRASCSPPTPPAPRPASAPDASTSASGSGCRRA